MIHKINSTILIINGTIQFIEKNKMVWNDSNQLINNIYYWYFVIRALQ